MGELSSFSNLILHLYEFSYIDVCSQGILTELEKRQILKFYTILVGALNNFFEISFTDIYYTQAFTHFVSILYYKMRSHIAARISGQR